jgi:hypothetical protein
MDKHERRGKKRATRLYHGCVCFLAAAAAAAVRGKRGRRLGFGGKSGGVGTDKASRTAQWAARVSLRVIRAAHWAGLSMKQLIFFAFCFPVGFARRYLGLSSNQLVFFFSSSRGNHYSYEDWCSKRMPRGNHSYVLARQNHALML